MTTIEWTRNPDGSKGKTWNPIRARNKETGKRGWFCAHVHEGCKFCYAERINIKAGDSGGNGVAYKAQNEALVEIYLDEETLLAPLNWKKPQRIFVCSMSDLYGPWVKNEWLDKIKAVQAETPQHTFMELTKRPERMREYKPGLPPWPLSNVWGLVSCSTQEDADKFIPILLDTPLAKRGVSLEPLLGPIDLTRLCILPQKPGSVRAGIHIDALHGRYCESGVAYTGDWDVSGPAPPDSERRKLDWVIAGGESGTAEQDVRPMHPDWLHSLREQCASADVPFFFKQWGEWIPSTELREPWHFEAATVCSDGRVREWQDGYPAARLTDPHMCSVRRVGKNRAGRNLDGAEHNEFPQQASS